MIQHICKSILFDDMKTEKEIEKKKNTSAMYRQDTISKPQMQRDTYRDAFEQTNMQEKKNKK